MAFGQAAAAIAVLANIRVLTEFLVPAELGVFTLLVGAASILIGMTVWPLSQAILVDFGKFNASGRTIAFRAVAFSRLGKIVRIVALAVCVLGLPLAAALGTSWRAPILVAGLFAVDAHRVFYVMLYTAERRQRFAAIVYAAEAWLRVIVIGLALYLFASDPYIAMMAQLVSGVILVLVVVMVSDFELRTPVSPDDKQTIEASLSTLARPLYPAAVLTHLTDMGGRFYLAGLSSLSSAGIFAVSYGLVKRPYGILNSVADWTLKPVLSAEVASASSGGVRRVRLIWLGLVSVAALVGALLFFLMGDFIVKILMTSEYSEAADILGVIALGVALFNVANVFNSFSLTLGDGRAMLVSSFAGGIASVLFSIPLILNFGLWGACLAIPLYYTVQFVVAVLLFLRKHQAGTETKV